MDTIKDVVDKLPRLAGFSSLPTPDYCYRSGGMKVGLAVESMKNHMTNEGWELFAGLDSNGYTLCGYQLDYPFTDVTKILDGIDPSVVVLQDKREWDCSGKDFREPRARFTNVNFLSERNDVFKLTVLKDAQQRPTYHRDSAKEIGCHAWITYYATPIVRHLAPYVRQQHLVRTYHTVDPITVPKYSPQGRKGCLLSGAICGAYPLRSLLFNRVAQLPETDVLHHPGYHRRGSATPNFLRILSGYKVAICTASKYGYALRKIIEATACGCVVITNLPADEILPEIDGNLIRVPSDIGAYRISDVIRTALREYDPEVQKRMAQKAMDRYDYRVETKRIVEEIEYLRADYP